MDKGKHTTGTGGSMAKSRRQILKEVEQIKADEDCSQTEAALIYLVELVENDRRAKVAEAYILSRRSGDMHANAMLEDELEKLGVLPKKGKK